MDPPLKTGPKPLVDLSVAGDGLDAFPQGLVSQQLDSWYTWWNRRPNDHRIWLLSACLTPISAAHEIVTLHFANSNRYQLIPIDHELYPSGTQHHQILATHQRIFAPRHPSVTRHEPEQCQAKRTKSGPQCPRSAGQHSCRPTRFPGRPGSLGMTWKIQGKIDENHIPIKNGESTK